MRKMLQWCFHHLIYPLVYYVGSRRRLRENKVVLVEVRGQRLGNSFDQIAEALQEDPKLVVKECYLHWMFGSRLQYLWNCIRLMWMISDAKAVFLAEACSVLGAFHKRKGTNIIQLWHGCGAFKKFGYSTAEAGWGSDQKTLEKYPLYANIDVFTVSSKEVVWAYADATHLPTEHIFPIGNSRTDVFFRKDFIDGAYHKLKTEVPQIHGRKVLLYAPTFRGELQDAATGELDYCYLRQMLAEDYFLLVHHHPFVRKRPEIPKECADFALDVTELLSMETLICVSDICIADYSSLVFEYALFRRPMVFYAYDLEEYDDFRGFYYPYEEMTPGPICRTKEALCEYILHVDERFDVREVEAFAQKFMGACDGHATQRILAKAFE